MPELPEVETARRYFESTVLHRKIASVSVDMPSLLEDTTAQGFGRMLSGRTFTGTRRRGKYLYALMDDGRAVVLHFGMTGYLAAYDDEAGAPDYRAATITFDDGRRLGIISKRKLGVIGVVEDVDTHMKSKGLGPDAYDIDRKTFADILTSSDRMIKAIFLDQSAIAGLGNEYGDEVLFQSRIHPRTNTKDMDDDAIDRIFDTMRRVLDTAIDKQADWERYPKTWLLPNREAGEPCPGSCGGTLEKISVGGRNGIFCPACQPE